MKDTKRAFLLRASSLIGLVFAPSIAVADTGNKYPLEFKCGLGRVNTDSLNIFEYYIKYHAYQDGVLVKAPFDPKDKIGSYYKFLETEYSSAIYHSSISGINSDFLRKQGSAKSHIQIYEKDRKIGTNIVANTELDFSGYFYSYGAPLEKVRAEFKTANGKFSSIDHASNEYPISEKITLTNGEVVWSNSVHYDIDGGKFLSLTSSPIEVRLINESNGEILVTYLYVPNAPNSMIESHVQKAKSVEGARLDLASAGGS